MNELEELKEVLLTKIKGYQTRMDNTVGSIPYYRTKINELYDVIALINDKLGIHDKLTFTEGEKHE